MDKVFEALERLAMPDELHIKECKKLGIGVTEDFDTVEKALLELTSIKKANHSEALECLEYLYCNPEDYRSNDRAKDYNTIKNYILKAQEPKQYLKWEDLKKSNLEERLKVKLNNVKYELHFEKWAKYDDATRISLYLNEFCVMSIRLKTNYEKQFFNDLHLERVEE